MSANTPAKGDAMRNPLEIPKGLNKRCDLPPEAYWHDDRDDYTPYAVRPGYNRSGSDIRVFVNQFRLQSVGNRDVFQYDVAIFPEPSGAIVYKKAWNTSMVQGKLAQQKAPWLYDNRKLAWSTCNITGFKCEVDLGADEGRPGRKNNVVTFEIKQTCKVRMEALKAYLEKRISWDNTVLECMSFLDHVLRQGPSERMHLIKRTLINEHSETKILNPCTEAIKGIYSAIRLTDSIKSGGLGLGVNVDVSNQTFWIGQKFENLVRSLLACVDPKKWGNIDLNRMRTELMPVKSNAKDDSVTWAQSEAFKALRRLQNVRFEVKHRGKAEGNKVYKVKRIAFDPRFGELGACARTVTFDKKMPDGTMKTYNIADYYMQQYKTRIQYWWLPLVETTNAGYFPMEVCEVVRFNPYPFKLDAEQTSAMITFSQANPRVLKPEIMKMVRNLEWDKDRYLAHFGIKISPTMPAVSAKLLPNPVVQYGNRTVDPKTSGRWDLRGIRFVTTNTRELKHWAVVIFDNRTDKPTAHRFAQAFKSSYTGHGGKVSREALIIQADTNLIPDEVVARAYQHCGATFQAAPQMMFFIIPKKATWPYDRLKRNADCRYGCLTQMVVAQHVKKCSPQYISNLCMKVNAKLGGQTSRIAGRGQGSPFFAVPTMMIGVDISHGNTSIGSVSTAAMCVSMDKDAAVYSAAVQTNGWGVEIVQPANMHSMLGPLIDKWRAKFKTLPHHVFYMRDGVSEGQFAHVMEFEVGEIKRVFKEYFSGSPKITVIVATKRHHLRIFPERGDRNENCLPGTLVEREITHPFHYDFFLCSHVALQGTARPVHYNVIHDECGLPPDTLQRILYEQCYQYCRSTTPVSLHPAVYYAHLAGARARHHEPAQSTVVKGAGKHIVLQRPGLMAKGETATVTSRDKSSVPGPLLKIGGHNDKPQASAEIEFFKNTMWWV